MGVGVFDTPDITKHSDAFTYMLHRLMEFKAACNERGKLCLTPCDPFFDLLAVVPLMLKNKQLT